jgi:hypothetical protein
MPAVGEKKTYRAVMICGLRALLGGCVSWCVGQLLCVALERVRIRLDQGGLCGENAAIDRRMDQVGL